MYDVARFFSFSFVCNLALKGIVPDALCAERAEQPDRTPSAKQAASPG